MRGDCSPVVVCGHGAWKAARFVNAAGNFVGGFLEPFLPAVAENYETAAVIAAINKGDGAHNDRAGNVIGIG